MGKKTSKDPYAKREAENYDNPIPSREFIIQYLRDRGDLVARDELTQALKITEPEQEEALRRRLIAMTRDGQLIKTRKGCYGLIEKMDLILGRVQAHRDGHGFVIPDKSDKADKADIFLPERQMRSVFDGDKVLVRPVDFNGRGRKEGIVVEVVQRNTQQIVGRLSQIGTIFQVIPENKRLTHEIIIVPDGVGDAEPDQIVRVEIIEQPSRKSLPVGRVVEVLGEHMAPGMEIDIAIRSYEIPYLWSDETQLEADSLGSCVQEADKLDRLDLRDLPLVTIDGEDAKDFDDAVYCERVARGWHLYVAIADVSHYVKPGMALDDEAKRRGTSVYFPGRVVPMLPKQLSAGLCSLKPRVDRLCLVCKISITSSGKVRNYEFQNALICSHARLTYNKVASLLVGDKPALTLQYEHLLPHLTELNSLFQVLHKQRQKRGAIDFEIPETGIVFGKDRKIAKIEARERNDAHRIIEECMLVANVCAAELLKQNKIPCLYRTHGSPEGEKLTALKEFLAEISLRLKGGKKPKPGNYRELLEQVRDRVDFNLIQTVMLRSLKRAEYTEKNDGHFGLAYPTYAHFTSPIRRYPDLLVHRAIKYFIGKKVSKKKFAYNKEQMNELGEHCSTTERRADDATRDAIDWLKCEFMQDKIGEEFTGTISGVTHFGLFVTLKEVYVDGLLHITALQNDYYRYHASGHRLVGERSGKVYRLGDEVKIKVARVSLDDRNIDFDLVDGESTKKTKTKAKRKKRR